MTDWGNVEISDDSLEDQGTRRAEDDGVCGHCRYSADDAARLPCGHRLCAACLREANRAGLAPDAVAVHCRACGVDVAVPSEAAEADARAADADGGGRPPRRGRLRRPAAGAL
jgi:hypothetical protein